MTGTEASVDPLTADVVTTDVLVLGGGVAAHRAAVAAREAGAGVAMVYTGSGASPKLICFNVPVVGGDPRDSPAAYVDDMRRGGCGLNDGPLIEALAADTPAALAELETIGVEFVRRDGAYAARHLGGSTYPRGVFSPDGLGPSALKRLQARSDALGVTSLAGGKVVGLLTDGSEVVGALAVRRRSGTLVVLRARAVVLAMGGLGRLYEDSTYPADVAGEAYALAYDAGARLVDMEFVQFEPTVVVHPAGARGMEMPTAMLGDGAHLTNASGERFMFRVNPEHGERAIDKARMSLAIQREIDEGRGLPDGSVRFDTTVLEPALLEGYTSHVKRLRNAGVEPTVSAPHVRPAAHSMMGGVRIDARGFTGVRGLWACGEAAGGVHGASRLAGNSGSDVLVFGARAGRAAAAATAAAPGRRDWAAIQAKATASFRAAVRNAGPRRPDDVKAAVRGLMSRAAGLYRREADLKDALRELDALAADVEGGLDTGGDDTPLAAVEARSMLLVARMVVSAALARTESRGAHQRVEFPEQNDRAWLRHLAVSRRGDGGMAMESLPLA